MDNSQDYKRIYGVQLGKALDAWYVTTPDGERRKGAQQDLSIELGKRGLSVTQGRISEYKNGTFPKSPAVVAAISEILGHPVSFFFDQHAEVGDAEYAPGEPPYAAWTEFLAAHGNEFGSLSKGCRDWLRALRWGRSPDDPSVIEEPSKETYWMLMVALKSGIQRK